MRKIGLLAVLAAVTLLLVLGVAAVAQAATPVDIYNDYAKDAALTGPYTAAELQAYLDDVSGDGYPSPNPAVTVPLDDLVGRVLGIMKANPGMSFADALAQALGQPTGERKTYPFTGFEVLLVLLGGVLLVGSGLVVRRATR